MRRRYPGETWRDWRRRNEPELVLIAFCAAGGLGVLIAFCAAAGLGVLIANCLLLL